MEFPDLGQHCSETTCNRLDFLPMKCDACEKVFCKDHIRYDDHKCSSAYKKDNQVPVCPLCGQPVPVPRGEMPDLKVGEHIDRDCQSDPAKKKRKVATGSNHYLSNTWQIREATKLAQPKMSYNSDYAAFSNRCSMPRCKQKELMPVVCSSCRLNFCLRHRHPQDHDCKGFQGSGRSVSNAGAAAVQRHQASTSRQKSAASKTVSHPPQQTYMRAIGKDLDRERRQRQEQNARAVQSNMSEDEALARALQLSKIESESKPLTQEEQDLALARQLQQEEEENRTRRREQQQHQRDNRSSDSSCTIS